MRSEEHKGTCQQYYHEPEGVVQDWIFGLVVMCGMCQISDELTVGVGVTFLTGLHNIFPAER